MAQNGVTAKQNRQPQLFSQMLLILRSSHLIKCMVNLLLHVHNFNPSAAQQPNLAVAQYCKSSTLPKTINLLVTNKALKLLVKVQ